MLPFLFHSHAFELLSPSLAGRPVWPATARVQRGPSEAARCASTGDQLAAAFLFGYLPLRTLHFLSGREGRSLTARIEGPLSEVGPLRANGASLPARIFPPLTALSTGTYNPATD
jgi:hypothetical protein